MSEKELIEVLRQFDDKRVEELPEKTRNIFFAIMKIADERDELENIRKEIKKEIKKYAYTDNFGDTVVLAKYIEDILNKGGNNE